MLVLRFHDKHSNPPSYACSCVAAGRKLRFSSGTARLTCCSWNTIYRVIMAALTALQPYMDMFLFFVPFYYVLKLAFACYLWVNDLQGTEHVYTTYVRPMVRRHEPLVDFKLTQMRALLSHMVSSNMRQIVQYVQLLLVKTLSQSVAEGGSGQPRSGNMRRDESASFHTAQEDFSSHSREDRHGRYDRHSDAYFDKKLSPLRAGGSSGR